MTKTLTEQWREGTIVDGWYYLDYDTQEVKVEIKDGRMYMDGIIVNRHSYGDDIDLMTIKCSVPSYDEYCNLVFQANKPKNPLSDVMMCYDTEREKKVVERLQEQQNDANEALKCISHQVKIGEFPCDACGYSMKCEGCWCGDLANDYLEKWGVK